MLTSLFPLAHARYSSLPVLGDVLEPLCAWLAARGFPPDALRRRVAAAPFLDQFLQRRQIHSVRACTAAELRACLPRERRWTPQLAYALGRSVLAYLAERGELVAAPPTASEELAEAYRTYLERVRGLAPSTARRHAALIGHFLRFLRHDDGPATLRQLDGAQVEAFLTQAARRLRRASMQKVVAVLRSFLAFAASRGAAPTGVAAAIDSPRVVRAARLARALPWDAVRSLLGGIDRATLKGRRDYAMLLLLATYGLRVGEVAALRLDDIAWRARRLQVPRPKIGAPLLLPLTDEVATALLDYLRHRGPASTHRHLFCRVRVPSGPLQATGICDAFDASAARAGLRLPGLGGTHCLRHAVAMHLLRRDTSLKTIGDLLGHRSAESTGVYLRLQVEDLRDVALGLPRAAYPEGRP